MTAPDFNRVEESLADLSWAELAARVARAQLYVIESATQEATELTPAEERAHLAYLYRLESEGRLFGSGPLDRNLEGPRIELSIVAASSIHDAESIAKSDPILRGSSGRSTTVRAHTMNEGIACYVGRALERHVHSRGLHFDPGLDDVGLTLEELQSRAAGAYLQAVFLNPTDKPRPADDKTMESHFVWLRENEMAAKLLSCGPVHPPEPYAPGIWGAGLGVLATSRTEAERIAAEEPSAIAGYRVLTVVGWTLNYGVAAPIGRALEALGKLP